MSEITTALTGAITQVLHAFAKVPTNTMLCLVLLAGFALAGFAIYAVLSATQGRQ